MPKGEDSEVSCRALSIHGSWLIESPVHSDPRGSFCERFRRSDLERCTGEVFAPLQMNVSKSCIGTVRGIHGTLPTHPLRKYVTCVAGSILDVVVDLRANSSSFGAWDSVVLNSASPSRSVFVGSGLGHAFQALSPMATVAYLVDAEYHPDAEIAVNPFDRQLAISWVSPLQIRISQKDARAQSLTDLRQSLTEMQAGDD